MGSEGTPTYSGHRRLRLASCVSVSPAGPSATGDAAADRPAGAAETADPILAALEGGEALSLGRLEAATGLSTAVLLAGLSGHEIAGRIVRLPGGAFRTPPTAVVR